jgi:hypothetical protein
VCGGDVRDVVAVEFATGLDEAWRPVAAAPPARHAVLDRGGM